MRKQTKYPIVAALALLLVPGCVAPQNAKPMTPRLAAANLAAVPQMTASTFASQIAAQGEPTLDPPPAPAVAPAMAATVPTVANQPPAVAGSRLQSAETTTATQKALELAQKLNDVESDRSRLMARIEELESTLRARDLSLKQATAEIQAARAEMAEARESLEKWKREIADLRDKLRGADEENLHTLHTAVSLLQQILNQAEEHDTEAMPAPAPSSSD